MKISRSKKINADTAIGSNKYSTALELLKSACNELSPFVKEGDQLAADSIANIGVVVLDLIGDSEGEAE